MAYPNFYSAPNNFQAPQQPQYQQPVAQSNIIWVQSESGAKAFPQGVIQFFSIPKETIFT